MRLLFLLSTLLISLAASAQAYDHNWLLGYGPTVPGYDWQGTTMMNFAENKTAIERAPVFDMDFTSTKLSMSDTAGNYQFCFNGYVLKNEENQIFDGGEMLIDGPDPIGGTTNSQGAVAVPRPGHQGQFYLFYNNDFTYTTVPTSTYIATEFHCALIDVTSNGGEVVETHLLLNDTIATGKLSAVKHANGLDWWIPVTSAFNNEIYIYLATSDGVELSHSYTSADDFREGVGQASFSPDGGTYVIQNGHTTVTGHFTHIFDFDRCTGTLSGQQTINVVEVLYATGAAISPNSRFLYVATTSHVYQYDLWADDLEASRVLIGEYDGYEAPFPTYPFQCQLAPDGKIYMSSINAVGVLHVVHRPDLPYPDCRFEQHGVLLPTYNSYALPNFPNYRLGPLDGSPCDTLGIDNLPLADFRYYPDTLDLLAVEFDDLSYYEPTEWLWDFGDGSTATTPDLVHTYAGEGTYEACLTASNANGSHTRCRTLYLGTTTTDERTDTANGWRIHPNPATDHVTVSPPQPLRGPATLHLYDALGRPAAAHPLAPGYDRYRLPLGGLPGGVYAYRITDRDGRRIGGGKLLVLSGH